MRVLGSLFSLIIVIIVISLLFLGEGITPILEVPGSQKHTLHGIWDEGAQALGTWTLLGRFRDTTALFGISTGLSTGS